MQSKITGLRICIFEKMSYVVGYKVQVLDKLNKEVLDYLKPANGEEYLIPTQMQVLLDSLKDKRKFDDPSMFHSMVDLIYEDDYIYPCLTVNDIVAIRYNIPKQIINVDKMSEVNQDPWIDYIQALQADYYAYHKMEQSKVAPIYFPRAITTGPERLPNYINVNVSLSPEKQIKAFDDKIKEQVKIEQLSLEKEVQEDTSSLEYLEKVLKMKPPFEYDRSLSNLTIPAPGTIPPPNFDAVLAMLKMIQSVYGFGLSYSGLNDYYREVYTKDKALYESLLQDYGVDFFSLDARVLSSKPIAPLLAKYIEVPESTFKNKNSYSCTKDKVEKALRDLKNQLTDENVKRKMVHLEKVLSYMGTRSTMKQLKELMNGASGGKDNYELHREDDTIIVHCCVSNESETRRYTTSDPNMQGKCKAIKSLISGRTPDRKIASIDIKAQELTILIFGIMENEELQRYTLETGDGYYAFAKMISDEEYTPEFKALIKIPILAIMNGKSKDSIVAEMMEKGRLDIGEKIYGLIQSDPGYMKILKVALEESKRAYGDPTLRRGLFGTVVPALKKSRFDENSAGVRKRRSLNSNYQMTASEIVAYSYHCMIYDLVHKTNRWGLGLEDITPIISIYDEMLFDIAPTVDDQIVKDFITYYICPKVSNWGTMKGEIEIGPHYIGK